MLTQPRRRKYTSQSPAVSCDGTMPSAAQASLWTLATRMSALGTSSSGKGLVAMIHELAPSRNAEKRKNAPSLSRCVCVVRDVYMGRPLREPFLWNASLIFAAPASMIVSHASSVVACECGCVCVCVCVCVCMCVCVWKTYRESKAAQQGRGSGRECYPGTRGSRCRRRSRPGRGCSLHDWSLCHRARCPCLCSGRDRRAPPGRTLPLAHTPHRRRTLRAGRCCSSESALSERLRVLGAARGPPWPG